MGEREEKDREEREEMEGKRERERVIHSSTLGDYLFIDVLYGFHGSGSFEWLYREEESERGSHFSPAARPPLL